MNIFKSALLHTNLLRWKRALALALCLALAPMKYRWKKGGKNNKRFKIGEDYAMKGWMFKENRDSENKTKTRG